MTRWISYLQTCDELFVVGECETFAEAIELAREKATDAYQCFGAIRKDLGPPVLPIRDVWHTPAFAAGMIKTRRRKQNELDAMSYVDADERIH